MRRAFILSVLVAILTSFRDQIISFVINLSSSAVFEHPEEYWPYAPWIGFVVGMALVASVWAGRAHRRYQASQEFELFIEARQLSPIHSIERWLLTPLMLWLCISRGSLRH